MTEKPAFEKFMRYRVAGELTPLVAVHHRGMFSINRSAWEALGEPEAVEILYAPEEKIIGFRPAPRGSGDAYAIRQVSKSARQVEGRAFLRHYNLSEEICGRRYAAEMVGGVLSVDLNQGADNASGG